MRFSKTMRTLQNLQKAPTVNLSDILGVVQDILDDTVSENGQELSKFEVDKTAVQRWMIINHAFIKIPIEQAIESLSDSQRRRLEALCSNLKQKDKEVEQREVILRETEAQIEEAQTAYDREKKELDSLLEQLEQTENSIQHLQEQKKEKTLLLGEKNQEYKKIQDDLADEEKKIQKCADDITIAKEELARVNERYTTEAENLNTVTGNLESHRTELEKLKIENEKFEKALTLVQKELDDSKVVLEEQRSGYKTKIKDLQDIQAELSGMTELFESADKEYKTAVQTCAVQRAKIDDRERRIQSINEEIAKITMQANAKQEEYTSAEQIYNSEKQRLDELQSGIDKYNSELETIQNNIALLSAETQRMIGEIGEKRKILSEADTQQLKDDCERLDGLIATAKAEYLKLSTQKQEQEHTLQEIQLQLDGLQRILQELEQELDSKENERTAAQKQKNEQEYALKILKEDIANYQNFFDSREYNLCEQQIANYKKAVMLYEDGIEALFNEPIPVGCLNDQYAQNLMEEKEAALREQIDQIKQLLDTLKTEYISIIKRIEEEVNQYAM